MAELIFMKFGMHIMAPSFINPFHESVCVQNSIALSLIVNGSIKTSLLLLGNGSVKRYRGNKYTSNDRIIVGIVVFFAVLSYQGK
jgi:hypothetical protein